MAIRMTIMRAAPIFNQVRTCMWMNMGKKMLCCEIRAHKHPKSKSRTFNRIFLRWRISTLWQFTGSYNASNSSHHWTENNCCCFFHLANVIESLDFSAISFFPHWISISIQIRKSQRQLKISHPLYQCFNRFSQFVYDNWIRVYSRCDQNIIIDQLLNIHEPAPIHLRRQTTWWKQCGCSATK